MLQTYFRRAYAPLFLASSLLCLGGNAAAQTSPAAGAMGAPVHAATLVHVSDCNPRLNVQQSGGFVGYTPGFWGGPYWGDAYGGRFYQPPMTTTSPELAIHYKNISPKTMSEIEFGLVANGVLKAEVRDVGTFSNGAEIRHKFGISPNVFPIGTGLARCVPLRITFEDGTKWRNPNLPPPNNHIYYHP
jgi:hypothetical protein